MTTLAERQACGDAESAIVRCLDAIERLNPVLNAMLTVTGESALREARAADEASARGESLGLLHGVPIALKDCMDVRGVRTTFGSGAFESNVATADADVVRRLRNSGGIVVGKNNLHEWCFGGTTQNDHYGSCRNPFDPSRIPGGSSGGSGSAVAAGMCQIALGTDTGGSVRIPAAMCGVTGLRPTIGRISNTGVVEVGVGFDTVGPLAYRVSDVARAFAAIAGYDPADAASSDRPLENFLPTLRDGISGVRIGVPRTFFFESAHPDVAARVLEATRVLEASGAKLTEITLEGAEQAHEDSAFRIAVSDAASLHADRIRDEPETLGKETLRRLQIGTSLSAVEYVAARRRLEHWKVHLRKIFQDVDLIVTPTCPFVAPKIASAADMIETTRGLTRFTFALGHAGIPAISIPCGFDGNGMPVGMQLLGSWFSEPLLFRAGVTYQSRTHFHEMRPKIAA